MSASAEYRAALAAATNGFVRANYSYVGNSRGSLLVDDPDYTRPAYGLAGASLGLSVNQWELSFYAKNLFDSDKIIQRPVDLTIPLGLVLQPRTIGLLVSTKS